MKKIYFFVLLLVIIPFKCKATCNGNEINEYISLANNVNYTYDLVMKDDIAFFNVKLLNLTEGMQAKVGYNTYDYNGTNELNIGNFVYSNKVIVKIYACNRIVKSLSFETPGFNKYATDPLCKGIENYKLCSKWITQNIDYESFKKEVIQYRNSLEKNNEHNNVVDKENDLLNKIVLFLINYNIYILPFVIVGCSIGIIIIKKNEKNIIKFKI